jgi:hypothetical protein
VLGSDPDAIGADYLIRDSKKVPKNQIASAPLPDYHDSKKALLERVKFFMVRRMCRWCGGCAMTSTGSTASEVMPSNR